MLFKKMTTQLLQYTGLLALLVTATTAFAQSEGKLWANVKAVGQDSVVLQWLPANPMDWKNTMTGGFRVQRFSLNDEAITPVNNQFPWPSMAFGENPTILPSVGEAYTVLDSAAIAADTLWGDGYPAVIATMLYDSAFNDGIDPEGIARQQYDMIMLGAFSFPVKTGISLGLATLEIGLDTSMNYLYRITAVDDPTLTQDVLYIRGGGSMPRYRTSLKFDFDQHPFSYLLPPEPTAFPLGLRAKGMGDSVIVRWVPTDPELIRNAHKKGYYLKKSERLVETASDGSTNFAYNVLIDSLPIRPWSQDSLSSYLEANPEPEDAVLVAAQVMYGDTEAEDNLSEAEILQNLLVYGLQAADQSPLAAEVLGLRFVDRDVKPGSWYVYEITMHSDSLPNFSEDGYAMDQVDNAYDGPPALTGFVAGEGEYVINLFLDRGNEDNYNQYFFEKLSDQGNRWTPLHERPIVFEVSEEMDELMDLYLYPDSVSTLYQPFRYRVRGRNAFQEYSPWAEITAMARDRTAPPVAFPNDPEMITTEIVRISWDGEMSATAPDLAGYYVKMGHYSSVEDQPIVSELLPAGSNSWEYSRPGMPFTNDSSYFFQVAAVDTAGNVSNSFPVALRVIDSIPPAPPTGLQATMDTNGVVTLLWEASPEKDAAGYQVYFANDTTETFVQVTKDDLTYNYYKDTLTLNTLNEALYYRVSAFDRSYNNSEWSDYLRVERPDVVAPTPPILLLPKPSGDGVSLTWRPSSSTDAVNYLVYRRIAADESGQWELVDSVAATATSFADTSAQFEVNYQYTMYTLDDADLLSEQANIQAGRRIFTADIGGVGELTVGLQGEGKQARPQVQWTYERPSEQLLREADYRFMLYRATGNEAMVRYKQLKSKEPSFIDSAVEPGATYRYALMVVYSNGKKSGLSDEQAVTIPKEGE